MEPFEVMISESQERMLAIVRPERFDDVAEVCERWGLPCAVIGRVTDDGDIVGQLGDGRELARIPARALTSDAIVHERVAAPARAAPGGARAGRAGRGRRPPAGARAWTPAPCSLALLGSPNLASRRAVFEQYDSTVGASTVAGPGAGGAAVLRVAGTREGARGGDGRQRGGERRRSLAGRGDERRRGGAQRRDHRRAAARRDQLPQLRRPDEAGRVLAARPRPCAASGTRAGRSACRSPAGTCRCTTSRPAAGSRRRRRSASSGCWRTPRAAVGPAFRRAGDAVLLVGEAGPGLAGSEYARHRRRRAGGRPARARPRPRAAAPGVRHRGAQAGACSRPRRTSRAAGSRSRSRRRRCGASVGAHVRLPVASSPAVDLFGESPSRLVVSAAPDAVPAVERARAREHGVPIDGDRDGGRRPAASWSSPATARPAPPRSVARASPTRSTSRSPTSGGRGSTACRGRSAGTTRPPALIACGGPLAVCGVFGVSLPPGSGTEAAAVASTGLFALQHRGQESAGRGGQRRRRDLPVQGPRDDRPGPRRPAAPGLPRRPRDRALPLLHDRLDDLGERPADVPARAAATGRDRPQRQPREHARAPDAAGGWPRPPRRDDRHGAADHAPRRRACGGHGGGAAPAPAPGPRRVLAARPRQVEDHRHPRSARLPPARARAHPGRRHGGERRRSLGARRRARRLGPVVGDDRPGHRRRRVRARRRGRRDGDPRVGPGAALRALRPGRPGAVRVRDDLLRPPRLVHGGPQPVRGPAAHGRAARARAPGRGRPRHARAGHGGARPPPGTRRRAACPSARAWSAIATRGGRSSSPRRRCATAA